MENQANLGRAQPVINEKYATPQLRKKKTIRYLFYRYFRCCLISIQADSMSTARNHCGHAIINQGPSLREYLAVGKRCRPSYDSKLGTIIG
uniref:Uncharacterized protein n=1 Tax=Arundo donax TaxID=35708 RepID=A0A0A9A8D7_ARUDO